MFFKLIGQATVFKAVKQYKAAGFIPTVVGHTLDDKFQTHARIVDVEILPDTFLGD